MKKYLLLQIFIAFTFFLSVSCSHEQPKKWAVKNKQVIVYEQPKNLEFSQSECAESDSLVSYIQATEMQLKDSAVIFQLMPEEFFLKKIEKKRDELNVSVSFVDDCNKKFLGDLEVENSKVKLDFLPETDSTGMLITAMCYCRYDLDFRVKKLSFQNSDYELFINGKNVKTILNIQDVLESIKRSYR